MIDFLQNKRQPPRILRDQLELQETEILRLEDVIQELQNDKASLEIEIQALKRTIND